MFDLKLEIENFLSIKKAKIKNFNNITILVAPNRAGKTQLLQFLYSFFWSLWIEQKEKENLFFQIDKKIKNVFLIKNKKDLLSWGKEKGFFNLTIKKNQLSYRFYYSLEKKNSNYHIGYDEGIHKKIVPIKSPVYLQPAGLGDYYKGVYSLKKYYPHWKLISETITDLLSDLFIVSSGKIEIDENNKKLLELFEKLFYSKFYIQNDRIYIQEKNKKYGIEKTASGLKSLSWFYLILRYNLIGNIIFIDEPEVNLHPIYIDKLAYFLYKLSQNRKIFIATHSDYLLESFNKLIAKHDFKIDIWVGELENDRAVYTSYEANKDNLIDTTPLNETYTKIIKELFEYEGDIELWRNSRRIFYKDK